MNFFTFKINIFILTRDFGYSGDPVETDILKNNYIKHM